MSFEDFSIQGKKRGVGFSDPLFIYIAWERNNGPRDNEELDDIIEGIDLEYFNEEPQNNIAHNLPFLTFQQAELLFRRLRDEYQEFTFEGIALASQMKNDKISGKAEIDTTPRIVPFTIDKSYKNLVIPIIESARRDPRFEGNSHDVLAQYFTNAQTGLIPLYAKSLGLSSSQMPLYPPSGTVEGELPRADGTESEVVQPNVQTAPTKSRSSNGKSYRHTNVPIEDKSTKKIAVAAVILAFILLLISLTLFRRVSKLEDSIGVLNSSIQEIQTLQDNEHEIDVFSRNFLTYYYSGDKDKIKAFLADNDAKYTIPETATVAVALLEDISYNSNEKTYKVTYVVTFKDNDNITTNRVVFDVKKNTQKSSDYAWAIASEPSTKPYVNSSNTSSEVE